MIKIGKYEFESIEELADRLGRDTEEVKKWFELYTKTIDTDFNTEIKKDEKGRLILPRGTVIHGLAGEKFNMNILTSISEEGLLSAAAMKKPAADLGINGWCVEEEQNMQEFYDKYNTLKDRGGFLRVTDTTIGKVGGLGRIASFMPIEPKYKPIDPTFRTSKLAFIIQPTEEDSIVNEKTANGHIGSGTYANALTIPIGVPVNAISGILLSKGVSRNTEVINKLIELFPKQYITTPEGELIYEPNKEKSEIIEENKKTNINKRTIVGVAGEFGECLNENEPQVDNDNVNYYIAGSLAQMLYANAEKIEYCTIQDGKITEVKDEIEISEEAREKLLLTGRKIGDLDIIRLNGYNFKKNYSQILRNAMLINGIETLNRNEKSPHIANIINCRDTEGNLDNCVTNDRVCKLTTINGKIVYVASPETIIAQKLDKALKYYRTEAEEKKDIKDLVTFINGISECYNKHELARRVADAWTEKKGAIPVSEENKQKLKLIYENDIKPMEDTEEYANIDVNDVGSLLIHTMKNYIDKSIKANCKKIATQHISRNVSTVQQEIQNGVIDLDTLTQDSINKSIDE